MTDMTDMKVYRAVVEISDDCDPTPYTREELKDLLEVSPIAHTAGIVVKCIELTEMTEMTEMKAKEISVVPPVFSSVAPSVVRPSGKLYRLRFEEFSTRSTPLRNKGEWSKICRESRDLDSLKRQLDGLKEQYSIEEKWLQEGRKAEFLAHYRIMGIPEDELPMPMTRGFVIEEAEIGEWRAVGE